MFYPKLIDSTGAIIGQYSSLTSKVVCIGRNYSAHAKELNNPIPKSPLLFIKSSNTLVDLNSTIEVPKNLGECHHELEIAILIGQSLSCADKTSSLNAIVGVGLALDLTLRDLQNQLKSKGQPWERAKSFDGACPISGFIPINDVEELSNIHFELIKNDKLVQEGNSKNMLFDIISLIQDISSCFSLYPGDIVLTGTPEGVAPLNSNDKVQLNLNGQLIVTNTVS